jgi:hypothetical protein
MVRKGIFATSLVIVVVSIFPRATAAGLWNVSRNETAYVRTQFYNGGLAEEETDSTTDAMRLSAIANSLQGTRPGVDGASIFAESGSFFTESASTLAIYQVVQVYYRPGRSDMPGGSASANLISTIDLILPADSIELASRLNEDRVPLPEANMSWSTTIRNLTTETLILTIDEPTGGTFGPFSRLLIAGQMGDLIRISTSAQSSIDSNLAAASDRLTGERELDLVFTVIPEPTTLLLMLIGLSTMIMRRPFLASASALC